MEFGPSELTQESRRLRGRPPKDEGEFATREWVLPGARNSGELLAHSLVSGVGSLAYPQWSAAGHLFGMPELGNKLGEQISASGEIVRDVLFARGLEGGGASSWEGVRDPRLDARNKVVYGEGRSDKFFAGPEERYTGQMANIDPRGPLGAAQESNELWKYLVDPFMAGPADDLARSISRGPVRLGGRRPNSGYNFVPPAGSRKKYQPLYREMPDQDLARLSMADDLSDTELLYVYQELDRRGIDDNSALSLLDSPEDERVRERIEDLLGSLGPNELAEADAIRYRNLTPEDVANLPDDELEDMFHFILDESDAGNTEAADAMQRLWDDVNADRELQRELIREQEGLQGGIESLDEILEGGTVDGRSVRGVQPYIGNSREQSIFANELVDSIINLPPERLDYFDLNNFPHLAPYDDTPDAIRIIAGKDEPVIRRVPFNMDLNRNVIDLRGGTKPRPPGGRF